MIVILNGTTLCLFFKYELFSRSIKKDFYTLKPLKSFRPSSKSFKERIGVHHKDVISLLIGNLLGDGFAEKRSNATRFHFRMGSKNAEYIFGLHSFLKGKGYCSTDKPKVNKRIVRKNKVYFSIRFRTFSFSGLNYIYDSFYVEQNLIAQTDKDLAKLCLKSSAKSFKSLKVVPKNIPTLLTEKAFAVWFMAEGEKNGAGLEISIKQFSSSDRLLLQRALFERFNLDCNIQRHKDKSVLYFEKKNKEKLSKIIKPHMYKCMYYKLDP